VGTPAPVQDGTYDAAAAAAKFVSSLAKKADPWQ